MIPSASAPTEPAPTSSPKAAPVRAFAPLGALVLGVFGYVLVRWGSSPAFAPSPVGPDPIPASTLSRSSSWAASTCGSPR